MRRTLVNKSRDQASGIWKHFELIESSIESANGDGSCEFHRKLRVNQITPPAMLLAKCVALATVAMQLQVE